MLEKYDKHSIQEIDDPSGRWPGRPIQIAEHEYVDWVRRVHIVRELQTDQGLERFHHHG